MVVCGALAIGANGTCDLVGGGVYLERVLHLRRLARDVYSCSIVTLPMLNEMRLHSKYP